jgi:hypothetical protein
MTDEQIRKRIEELKAQREQQIAQVNVTTGAILAFEEMLQSSAETAHVAPEAPA